jgi:hypothetical protein
MIDNIVAEVHEFEPSSSTTATTTTTSSSSSSSTLSSLTNKDIIDSMLRKKGNFPFVHWSNATIPIHLRGGDGDGSFHSYGRNWVVFASRLPFISTNKKDE